MSRAAIAEITQPAPESSATTLIVVDAIPKDGSGRYVHYRDERAGGPGWRRLELGPIVHVRQDEWLDQIDRWHRSLSRRGAAECDRWWLVAGSRITAWYPFDLRPVLSAAAVIELCTSRQPGGKLHLLGFPPEALDYLAEWVAANPQRASVQIPRPSDAGARKVQSTWTRATVRLLASVFVRWLVRSRRAKEAAVDTVVVSEALSLQLMRQVGDHFFGSTFENPATKPPGKFGWFYLLDHFAERSSFRRFCDEISREASFDFDYLRLADFARIAQAAVMTRIQLRRVAASLPRLQVGQLSSDAFPLRFAGAALLRAAPVIELAFYYAFRRYLTAAKPTTVVYPYEEKGFERALILACAEQPKKPKTIGFAHAVYSQGHLYFRKQDELGRPKPDLIATTGPAMSDWLSRWAGLAPRSLVVTGTPRYASPEPASVQPPSLRLLFVSSYGYEVGQLVSMMQDLPTLFEGTELMVRLYRHDWRELQAQGMARLEALGAPLKPDEGSLAEQISWADVVLFASTSAGIEAVLRGRPVVRIVGDVFDANPMYGRDPGKAIPECEEALELRKWILAISAMNREQYNELWKRQHRVAAGIYSPTDGSAWARALASGK